ncbi:MAG: hypothetical protein Q8M95_13615 [Candidatus Methanoperedens sp.]|nr:hypothetical protein [Candidatus Methanoperedens sp.]
MMRRRDYGLKRCTGCFRRQEYQAHLNHNEWWFFLEDIVYILTDSSDPKQYIQKMKQRDEPLAKGRVQIVHTLTVDTTGTA